MERDKQSKWVSSNLKETTQERIIMETLKVELGQAKDIRIFGNVEYKGEVIEVEVVKFDKKNNVMGFAIEVYGKIMYIGAGKDTPKLSELQNMRVEITTQKA